MDLTEGISLWPGGCGPQLYKTVMMLRKKENKTYFVLSKYEILKERRWSVKF